MLADSERVVAIGLLTGRDLALLGPSFSRAFPIPDDGDFDALLRAIDAAVARADEGGR